MTLYDAAYVNCQAVLTLLTRAVEIWAVRESELIWATRLEADMKQFKQCDHL